VAWFDRAQGVAIARQVALPTTKAVDAKGRHAARGRPTGRALDRQVALGQWRQPQWWQDSTSRHDGRGAAANKLLLVAGRGGC
jgi:hypothetical protein